MTGPNGEPLRDCLPRICNFGDDGYDVIIAKGLATRNASRVFVDITTYVTGHEEETTACFQAK